MKSHQAFTLIELMITVAIIGILASIAVPNYQSSVRKARRADAEGALVSLANAMERHFTETSSYCGAAQNAGNDSVNCGAADGKDTGPPDIYPTQSPIDGSDKFYNLTINAAEPNSYTLAATPINAQAGDKCGTLTLAHTGQRDITNQSTGVTVGDCW